jgi:hypothetical protein
MSTVELSVPRSLDARPSVAAQELPAASDVRWWRFLARWSLLAALTGVVGWAIFIYVSAQGVSTEGERGDLNLALQFPALWRVAMVYDTLAWLFIGGTVLTLAAILSRGRPILGVLLAAAALGELFGAMGGYVRLHTVSDLAAQYLAAGPDQQAVLLQTYHQVWLLVGNLQGFGGLLTKLGLLVIGCATFRLAGFPRWLAIGFAVQALIGLTFETTSILGISSPVVFLLMVVYVFAFLVWDIALAALFWRRSPGSAPVSASS